MSGKVKVTPQLLASLTAEQMPPNKRPSPLGLILLAATTSIIALFLLIRFHVMKHWRFALYLAVTSAIAGSLLATAGQEFCYLNLSLTNVGPVAGAIFGALVALCYASILHDTRRLLPDTKSFRTYAQYTGILTGMICSTLTHLAIIIADHSTEFLGLAAGVPFGIIAGAILGSICGAVISRSTSAQPDETPDC
jgi:hypothetical protein